MPIEVISRTKYDPYGNLVWANIQHQSSNISEDRYSYTGKELNSETGLVYFGARWYDGDTGRFVSTDLIAGYLGNPVSQNRYQYCFNNPVTYTDPMGLDPLPSFEITVTDTYEPRDFSFAIPSFLFESITRFWLEEWRTGMIFKLSGQYDMKLKLLEPNYSQAPNFEPWGIDGWEYMKENEFFNADPRAIETIERWYKNEPDVFGDFVMFLQRIERFLPAMRSAGWLGAKGTPGVMRNIYISIEPLVRRGPYIRARGGCAQIVQDLDEYLFDPTSKAAVSLKGISRTNPFVHHAHLAYLASEVKELGIVIDIWQSQSLRLFSVPKWYGGE
ncbi:RHS repeat-associated core domain-containing protein [bacterium]|nr:RHS repeat-associated core domain-containing protein [bacterium]